MKKIGGANMKTMILFVDDYNQIYYWTDELNNVVSPHFDYEDDAIQWKLENIKEVENNDSKTNC